MIKTKPLLWILFHVAFLLASVTEAEQAGSIRGTLSDADFDVPLPAAKVTIAETGQTVTATDEGNYVFTEVQPGTYTLVFAKDGYTRQVKADVVVTPGQLTEVNASLSGEFVEMEEFVVEDVQIGAGTEAFLLDLRMESPAMLDSVSAEFMSQAGASDAASALRLVSGASVAEGKYAVVRGLPDRYVNSQMNGVRLPTADADKRAVQLDQFPAAAIDSIQVSKTFTPDQQGDASGGAVNIVLKSVPDEPILKLSWGGSVNSQVTGNDDFLSYETGGVNFWGKKDREAPDGTITDASGAFKYGDAPFDNKWSITAGGKHEIMPDVKIGGLGTFFYERDSSFYTDGINDKYWVENRGDPMTPQYKGQDDPEDPFDPMNPAGNEFQTSLFDVTKGSQQVQWGALGILGLEMENHSLNMLYMTTRSAEDEVTLQEDTRGKSFYFPDYNVNDPCDPGNSEDGQLSAPWLRTEKRQYTERTTETLQFSGRHTLPFPDLQVDGFVQMLEPEFDWVVARSSAGMNQPDKQLFNSLWLAPSFREGSIFPPSPSETLPAEYNSLKGTNINFGNFHRIWKKITEQSDQYSLNLKFPFEQWSGDEGYVKFGIFDEELTREYRQDSFANAGFISRTGVWEDKSWSWTYDRADVDPADIDMDYDGKQKISAYYYMVDVPLNSWLKVIGGVRHETTKLNITTTPDDEDVVDLIYRNDEGNLVQGDYEKEFADVDFKQRDVLPAASVIFAPFDSLTLRGAYTETVARQTFKELSPVIQQEYLGGDVFVGNNQLQMSSLRNYDLRLDWNPYRGGMVSVSWFRKDIKNPIEYVQGYLDFGFTTPTNYPKGRLTGWELEVRQDMGHFFEWMEGLSLGGNATFIDSEVTLPDSEAENLANLDGGGANGFATETRHMVNAPEHLYNLFLTYDLTEKTKFSVFYTVRGDTLIAGAGQSSGQYIPDVYETEYGTLNMGISHKFNDTWSFKFQAKNLLNPKIESVYRSEYIDEDVTKTSYRKGMEFSFSISATF